MLSLEHDDTSYLVLVRIGDQNYGIPTSQVGMFTQMPNDFIPVPIGADWVLGVASLGGNVVICNDLSRMIDNNPSAITMSSRILIPSRIVGIHVGLLVNKVYGWVEETDIEPFYDNFRKWITGYGEDNGKHFAVMDIAKLVSSDLFLNAGSPVFAGQAGVDGYAARAYEKL